MRIVKNCEQCGKIVGKPVHNCSLIPWNKGLKTGYAPWLGKKRLDIAGENNYRWVSDRTKLKRTNKQGERRTSIYVDWRKQVYTRDNFKCKINNQDCKGRLEAHHILSWKDYLELRYEINNGITLCHAHHPMKRAEEKRLIPFFQGLVPVSSSTI